MSLDVTKEKFGAVGGGGGRGTMTKLNRFVQFFDGGWGEEGAYRQNKWDLMSIDIRTGGEGKFVLTREYSGQCCYLIG